MHVILDAAHNEDGMHQLFSELDNVPDMILFGCTEKHNISGIIDRLLDFIADSMEFDSPVPFLVITKPIGGRLAPVIPEKIVEKIAVQASLYPGLKVREKLSRLEYIKQLPDFREAYEFARETCYQISRHNPTILCLGSVYLVGNILQHLDEDVGSILKDQ